MRTTSIFLLLGFVLVLGLAPASKAQSADPTSTTADASAAPVVGPEAPPIRTRNLSARQFIQNKIIRDQKQIWRQPIDLVRHNYKILVPLTVAAAALIATDRFTSRWVDRPGMRPVSRKISRAGGPAGSMATAAALYFAGRVTRRPRLERTGLLAAEALVDAVLVTQAIKLATGRQRPAAGLNHGHFFEGGVDFPSGHTAAAWAVATVVASQYHNHPLIKYAAFIAATAIGFARYSGHSHFLSDVITGGAVGYGIGLYVYRQR